MKIDCPHCGSHFDISPDCIGQSAQCSECGNKFTVVNPTIAPCPDCFSPISKRASICPKCGAPLKVDRAETPPQDQTSRSSENEVDIAVFHPQAMAYFWQILFGILTIPLLGGIFLLILVIIEINCTSYSLTNKRIVIKTGWLSQKRDEIWICDMRGINMLQGIWQRMINVGNVAIGTAATGSHEIVIMNVKNPQRFIASVNSLRAQSK